MEDFVRLWQCLACRPGQYNIPVARDSSRGYSVHSILRIGTNQSSSARLWRSDTKESCSRQHQSTSRNPTLHPLRSFTTHLVSRYLLPLSAASMDSLDAEASSMGEKEWEAQRHRIWKKFFVEGLKQSQIEDDLRSQGFAVSYVYVLTLHIYAPANTNATLIGKQN